MNEQDKKQIEAIVELLSDTELSLESFNLDPVMDENGDIKGMKLTLVNELIDLQEGNDSTLDIIENHLIDEGHTFKDVLEKLVESQNEEEKEEE